LDFIIINYQTVVAIFWLSDCETDTFSVWLTVDHVQHFAATSFTSLQQFCMVSHGIFNIALWTSYRQWIKQCLYHRTRIFFRQVLNCWVLHGGLLYELHEHGNFWTQIFYKVVLLHVLGMVMYLNMTLLQIYCWVCHWKNFENRLLFGEVMCNSTVFCFLLTHSVV